MTAYRKLNVTLYFQLYPIKKVHKINFLGYFVSLCVIKDLYNGQTSRKKYVSSEYAGRFYCKNLKGIYITNVCIVYDV